MKRPVYMDNHATTQVDPRVVAAMLPYFSEHFGNAGSSSHHYGWEARDAVERARESIARALGAKPREILFTSGATESNNLAIRGVADRIGSQPAHFVTVATEHKAVLDPFTALQRRGFEVTRLPVCTGNPATIGQIDLQQFADSLHPDTWLASVMLANNEIGTIQPIAEIAAICRESQVLLHCDATQAIGRIPVDLHALDADLVSFTAHKLYGPKGIGALFVRRRSPQVRLVPQIDGGGQERGLRSGTLNVPGIVGFGAAVELAVEQLATDSARCYELRRRLFDELQTHLPEIRLNGPSLSRGNHPNPLRLAGNLNLQFPGLDGEALMMSMGQLAVSSGSACTSASPEPSHVLRAIGLTDDQVRCSLRFGLGRFNTEDDVQVAVAAILDAVTRLRRL